MLKKLLAAAVCIATVTALFGCGTINLNVSTDIVISVPEEDISIPSANETSEPTEASAEESKPEESVPEESVPEESVPEESVPEESKTEESIPEESTPVQAEGLTAEDTVVFLGDSIAQGYGLADVEGERYSTLIGNKYGCKVYNYAISGDDGADLIALLDSGSCTELKNATVIVMSIGANNVLGAASLLSPNPDSSPDENPELDVTAVVSEVAAGADRFKTELPQIIQKIRQVNPDAQIVYQTVYNPYKDFDNISVKMGVLNLTFSAFSASSVKLINDIIEENADTLGYTLCHVGDAFDQSEVQLVNALPDGSNYDPHPNKAGHEYIAELVAGVIK